jgi:mRNA interferase YafQ
MPNESKNRKKPRKPVPKPKAQQDARELPRILAYTAAFKRDFKREKKGAHRAGLDDALKAVLAELQMDRPLKQKHSDHALRGEWAQYRDCHIKPDLVLIYRKHEDELQLVRLGSHAELDL